MKKTLFFSSLISLITFVLSSYIFSKMIPYQDAPKELLDKQKKYIKTYEPLMNLLDIIFLISLVITLVLLIILIIRRIRKKKITYDLDKPK